MRSEVFSGDNGLAVIEHAPFGVIGTITPVTHSLPTITGNAGSMIAAGDTMGSNPPPRGGRGRAGVARAAGGGGGGAVGPGPATPPVVVDETAELDRAARAIIRGAAYDNNLLCIAEKEVFVVASVFDAMLSA